jgi:hypothetical protein
MAYSRPPQIVITNGGALKQTPDANDVHPPGIVPVELEAKIATTSSLGVVQIGEGIDITPEGVISVTGSSMGCNTILTGEDYECESDDCYIGVDSIRPVTISLPVDISDGQQIVVKAEMGSPMGNRKVTINTLDGSKIDNNNTVTLENPYSCLYFMYRGKNWHIIGSYNKS